MPVSESCLVVSDSLRPRGLCSPWSFPGQNTGVGSLSLLQGIFPTQGSNPGLPHCRQILYPAEPQGKPSEMPSGKLSSFLGQVPMNPVSLIQNMLLDKLTQLYTLHVLPRGETTQPTDRCGRSGGQVVATPLLCYRGYQKLLLILPEFEFGNGPGTLEICMKYTDGLFLVSCFFLLNAECSVASLLFFFYHPS